MKTTKLSVKAPNCVFDKPNVNGLTVKKELYINALNDSIAKGLPIALSLPKNEVSITQGESPGKVVDYTFEDNDGGLILDIEVNHNQAGEALVLLFEQNPALYGCFEGRIDGGNVVSINNFLCFYHAME